VSGIFKPYELQDIERRKNGDLSDKNGTFSSRVKPKFKELLEVWFPKKRELKRLIKPKSKILNR
jgi:hypothetical protein